MGAVCKKHEEFYEKECRWCVPEEIKGPSAAAAPPPQAQATAFAPRMSGGLTMCRCGAFWLQTHLLGGYSDGGKSHAPLACVDLP